MKKPVKIALIVVGGLVVIGAIAGSGSKSNTQSVPNSNANSSQATTPTSVTPAKEKITIKNSSFQDKGYGFYEVVGEVTNNDTATRTMTLKATFYDKAGKIMGTAVGAVNELAAGETKTFNLGTSDKVTGYADFKVQVDSLF